MSLADTIRSAVAVADKVTAALQVTVQHEPKTAEDKWRKPAYGPAVQRKGIVEYVQRLVKSDKGVDIMTVAKVTMPRDVVVSMQDRLTLPDGTKGPVVSVGSVVDPVTGRGYVAQVWMAREES